YVTKRDSQGQSVGLLYKKNGDGVWVLHTIYNQRMGAIQVGDSETYNRLVQTGYISYYAIGATMTPAGKLDNGTPYYKLPTDWNKDPNPKNPFEDYPIKPTSADEKYYTEQRNRINALLGGGLGQQILLRG